MEEYSTEEKNKVEFIKYSDEELKAINSDIALMVNMREIKNAPYAEVDDMTPNQYYESNRKKDLSYIPPKRNKEDIRIVTGTTREKDTTLLSTLLNLNAVPDVTAFDEEDMVVAELGDNMADLVKKSREIEDWQKKRPIVYRELISQGDVFLFETVVDDFRNVPLEKLEWNPLTDPVHKLSFRERLTKIQSVCMTRMIPQPHIYLGDMKIEYIEDQDTVAIARVYNRSQAQSEYGTWERWKNVPYTIETVAQFEYSGLETYKHWSMFNTSIDQLSEVLLFKKSANRFQIYLNGTPMLPCNYPLTALVPSGELPFAQGKLEPISNFALSKSQPSKTKVDQEVIDELTQLMVTGIRQSRKPPMGTKSKKAYGSGIFAAGVITNDVKENTFYSMLPPEALGIKAGEFSFYNLIKESINEKTVNEVYSGESQEGVDTLGQAQQMKEQQLLKLGSALDAVVNLERRLAWIRIDNILYNWTEPIDSKLEKTEEGIFTEINKYRKMSVETTVENGEQGLRVFRFQDGNVPDIDDQYEEEEQLSKEQGKNVRITYMNPKMLRAKKYRWFIIVVPTPKSNDQLSQLLFIQNVRTSFELFGPESMNMEYLKQRFSILINEDYNKMFKQMDIMQMLQAGQAQPAEGAPAPGGSMMRKPVPAR